MVYCPSLASIGRLTPLLNKSPLHGVTLRYLEQGQQPASVSPLGHA